MPTQAHTCTMVPNLIFTYPSTRRALDITSYRTIRPGGVSTSSCPTSVVLADRCQFVRTIVITHGDETRVGYYVGLMAGPHHCQVVVSLITIQHSIFFAAEAMTVLYWSRISDMVGRKPIILTGLFGLSLSMYGLGLSRTYWAAIVRLASLLQLLHYIADMLRIRSRILCGTLNGNIGVIKSLLAEIADSGDLVQIY